MWKLDFALLISGTLKDWNIEAEHSTLEGETHLILTRHFQFPDVALPAMVLHA